jgi:hypothetical protein
MVRFILDVYIYRPFLDEYKNLTSENVYEHVIELLKKIDNFSP